MKTTIDIADSLLDEARREAARRNTTLKALIEDALRQHIGRQAPVRFQLRKHPFMGDGLHPDLAGGSWSEIRDRMYAGRGG
jgi:hypothetical protein